MADLHHHPANPFGRTDAGTDDPPRYRPGQHGTQAVPHVRGEHPAGPTTEPTRGFSTGPGTWHGELPHDRSLLLDDGRGPGAGVVILLLLLLAAGVAGTAIALLVLG
ncbi:hypothetical protein [Nocardioides bruguierae]|uniref:Uncharacterized protein n=1 Tax=Nocardioides bruguierae TaxID=2945102 RepID=A0A9X2D5T4_9ACTN|nr:hypothetical protein [Nocardioides bruguierae]MCL8024153.1 hypothetical protein [Nocardioides bruguierae]MCM0619856.1 hypothetical protein [Nocardioides bruguierae]